MMEMPGRAWYEGPLKGTLPGYMLSHAWFGFPGPDTTAALRLLLEAYSEATEFIYDVTDLIWSGYAAHDEEFVAATTEISIEEMQSVAKIIVLTEGRSDASILQESLHLLYPHLSDYYSFMNFEGMRVGGGAGILANLLKAFAAAGVVNKTIALFDNDTAGRSALQTLAAVSLPEHLAVLTLPPLDSLKTFPTIGPSGSMTMDVNGLAGSLELYLGDDVLTDDDGPCEIQWTGYDQTLKQYQGQIVNKAEIQHRFEAKLEAAKETKASLGPDWDGLRAVFAHIFAAFHKLDQKRILEDIRSYYADERQSSA